MSNFADPNVVRCSVYQGSRFWTSASISRLTIGASLTPRPSCTAIAPKVQRPLAGGLTAVLMKGNNITGRVLTQSHLCELNHNIKSVKLHVYILSLRTLRNEASTVPTLTIAWFSFDMFLTCSITFCSYLDTFEFDFDLGLVALWCKVSWCFNQLRRVKKMKLGN